MLSFGVEAMESEPVSIDEPVMKKLKIDLTELQTAANESAEAAEQLITESVEAQATGKPNFIQIAVSLIVSVETRQSC